MRRASHNEIQVIPAREEHREWIHDVLVREWHGPLIERTDEYIDASRLPALVALIDEEPLGLMTLLAHPDHIEIVTLNSFREGFGIGSALLAAAEGYARELKLDEVRLFTYNANINGLAFYQRRGYRLWAVHRDTITRARTDKKPQIPLFENGILVADEVELRKQS